MDGNGAFCNDNEINDSGNDDENYNANNEQQQLSEGFANSCYKIVSPVLLQKLTILQSTSIAVVHFYLLKMQATVLKIRTIYFKKKPHVLIDQPRTCHVFMDVAS